MRVFPVIGLLALASLSVSCTAFSVAAPTTLKPFASKPVLSHRHDKVTAHVACIGAGCNTRLLSLSSPPTDGARGDPEETAADGSASKKQKTGLRKRLASYFKSSESDDGLTFRQRLAKMGLATVLSYGWISNTNAMILVASAWYVFCAKTGMSPLYPGQWKNFLAVYAGFYVVSNFLRPFRFTLAVMVGPYFERLVNWIQLKTRLPKAGAVTATVLLVNLGGTILLMVGGISLASFFSGVPVFAPKA